LQNNWTSILSKSYFLNSLFQTSEIILPCLTRSHPTRISWSFIQLFPDFILGEIPPLDLGSSKPFVTWCNDQEGTRICWAIWHEWQEKWLLISNPTLPEILKCMRRNRFHASPPCWRATSFSYQNTYRAFPFTISYFKILPSTSYTILLLCGPMIVIQVLWFFHPQL